MRMRLAALALLSLMSVQGGRAPAPLTVSAAISLTNVLEEIAQAYAKAGGGPVRFNLAGSNALARQIVSGAPVDLFVSADEAQMDVVQRAGAVVAGSRIDLVGNQLAVIARSERVAFVREQFARAPAAIRRLAMGDPAAVPAGVYARQYLERQGLWKGYEARVVPTANVRAALAAVENGSVDAAIVYVTDAGVAKDAAIAFVVPVEQGPRIVYPAAVLASSRNKGEAERFLAFLRGPTASAIFARYKFVPLTGREARL